jgi:diaminopimelate epimerase
MNGAGKSLDSYADRAASLQLWSCQWRIWTAPTSRGLGSAIRRHDLFAPKGANANFLKQRGPRQIAIRTYERGVEDETLACGTGVVASALIFAAMKKTDGPIAVLVRGGSELEVGFEKEGDQFKNVTLTGPAEFVFEGTIDI